MVRRLTYLLLIVIVCPLHISAQSEEITGRQDELQQLKTDIKNLEAELKAKTKKEQQSLESLQIFTKQGLYLNKIINRIRSEESRKEKEIGQTRRKINDIESEIKTIRALYSKYVVYLYKYGRADVLSFLVNSETLNQAFLRYRYFSRITERNKHNLQKLEDAKKELTVLNDKLQTELSEQRRLAEQKKEEEKELSGKISERQKIVKQLKNNKDALRKEIELKRRSEQEIRNLIAKLVEEEMRKAEEKRKAELLAKEKSPAVTNEIKPPRKRRDRKNTCRILHRTGKRAARLAGGERKDSKEIRREQERKIKHRYDELRSRHQDERRGGSKGSSRRGSFIGYLAARVRQHNNINP